MKLYFRNNRGIRLEIADVKSEDEAYTKISEFCEKRNYKIDYVRSYTIDNELYCDVGSHSEDFVLVLEEDSHE